MLHGNRLYSSIIYLLIIVGMIVPSYAAKTVYVISDTTISELQTYKIDNNELIYQPQADYICELDPPTDAGAIALAIDESQYGDFLFVTFELSDEIELVDAKEMQYIGYVTATGASNLAGIAMDSSKSKLYAVDRYTNHLYSYSWNPSDKILTPDFNEPFYVELSGLVHGFPEGAFGIALDEENGLLYVADNTDSIKYYNTNTWAKVGEVNVPCNAISVAVDVNNQLLYIGSVINYGQNDPCLYQYDISAQTIDSTLVGCSVAGIAVDQNTSLVYITTFYSQWGGGGPQPSPYDHLMIYDVNLIEQPWDSGDIGNPAGVTVSNSTGYKQPVFSIVKENHDSNNPCVSPFDTLIYDIYWDANGVSDTNVSITDKLPFGVGSPISDPCGDYNPDTRRVVWDLNDISGSDSGHITLTVKVTTDAVQGGTLTNLCVMEGDNYFGYDYLETAV
jgi:hypothetical protein